MPTLLDFSDKVLVGRSRRLYNEWRILDERLKCKENIFYSITKYNEHELPIEYIIEYKINSICGVDNIERLGEAGVSNKPYFASNFLMEIVIPQNYPCIDAMPEFKFLTKDINGDNIPHPWHPNIRYFGEFAGRVCLNSLDSYTDIAWCIERVELYLKYELYHAIQEPPYPEDIKVAKWVIQQGEPNNWVFFSE